MQDKLDSIFIAWDDETGWWSLKIAPRESQHETPLPNHLLVEWDGRFLGLGPDGQLVIYHT